MRTWLNALRYYLIGWVHELKTLNSRKRRSDYNLSYLTIPFINRRNWQKYHAKRKELLTKAAVVYQHSLKRKNAEEIIDCPTCGQETYMYIKAAERYRCYTCNDTPKEWR